MEVLSLSGNFCSDKKPAAVNWYETYTVMNYSVILFIYFFLVKD